MHLPSTRLWRGIAGFLLGVVLDGLALLGLGIDKSFNEASSHAQGLEVLMLPHVGIVALTEDFALPILSFIDAVQALFVVFLAFLLAIYPLAFTICFVLPWEKKRTISVVVTTVIVVAILSFGVVGWTNLDAF